jgi:predicted DNA-binding ribbon-helix-helix protein
MVSLSPRPRELSSLAIRNVVVAGHRTSVRLEPLMWDSLRDIARRRRVGLNELVTEIDSRREGLSLTAAIRVYIVGFYRNAEASTYEPNASRCRCDDRLG